MLVNHETLKSLKEEFEQAKNLIVRSIEEGRQIIIRQDTDCDGYGAGIALEKAILKVIKEKKNPTNYRFYFRRIPNRTPFYNYSDASRDAQTILDSERFGKRKPLIILADFGSGMENEISIKKIKLLGSKILVIDHHVIAKGITPSIMLNPHIKGTGSEFCSAMLACELSNILKKDEKLRRIAAIAGITDKCPEEIIKKYYPGNLEKLEKLSGVIDFEISSVKFFEGQNTVDTLFSESQLAEELVELLYPKIQELKKEQLETLKKHHEKKGNKIFVDLEKYCSRDYPPSGRSIGMLHDYFKNIYSVYGIGPEFIIIRTNDSVIKLIEQLRKKFPYAMISGGGHEKAGVITFLKGYKEEIVKSL